MMSVLSRVSSRGDGAHAGANFATQARRVSLTSSVIILVLLLVCVIFSCIRLQNLMEPPADDSNKTRHDDKHDDDRLSLQRIDPQKAFQIERGFVCAMVCLCLVAVPYTMLLVRDISRGLYGSFRAWMAVLVLLMINGTILAVFNAIATDFSSTSNAVLLFWIFMTLIKVNSIRSIYPLYKIWKLNGKESLNNFDLQPDDSGMFPPCVDVGHPPPIYTISANVEEGGVEGGGGGQVNDGYAGEGEGEEGEDVAPPKYQPKLTPPSYEEVIELPVDTSVHIQSIPDRKPPKYRP